MLERVVARRWSLGRQAFLASADDTQETAAAVRKVLGAHDGKGRKRALVVTRRLALHGPETREILGASGLLPPLLRTLKMGTDAPIFAKLFGETRWFVAFFRDIWHVPHVYLFAMYCAQLCLAPLSK